MNDKVIGTITIPDESNGPKVVNQPEGYHCHCAPFVIGRNVEKDTLTVRKFCGGKHSGKGGWWKNDDCKICTS